MSVGCIIQARMTSKRFPGKSIAKLEGLEIINHVVYGCLEIDGVDKVIVATPPGPAHEPIHQVVKDHFGGDELMERVLHTYAPECDENDVLLRYLLTAEHSGFVHTLRVTADCPCIQPEPCELVLNELLKGEVEYVTNSHPKRTLPKGLDCEGFTIDVLRRADNHANRASNYEGYVKSIEDKAVKKLSIGDYLYDREHVTPWMQRNIQFKNIVYDEDNSSMNLCVDWPNDIQRLESQIGVLS